MTALLIALSFTGILKSIMFVGFIFCAFLLILVILLQEPKGGGLSGAFGGAGAETFGVQTGNVNKFTSRLATVFLVLAIGYAAMREDDPLAASDRIGDGEPTIGAPADGSNDGASNDASSDDSDDSSDGDSSSEDTGAGNDSGTSDKNSESEDTSGG